MRQEELQNTFIGLVRQHERMIYKVCFLYARNETDRSDLFQEIVFSLWKGYPKFRGEAKFSTWLYQVAINTAIAGFRKESKSPVIFTSDLPETGENSADIQQVEQLQSLYAAISQLNDIEKAIVMLYLEGKTYEEMEAIMGIASGALRVRMTRIKEKLKKTTKN